MKQRIRLTEEDLRRIIKESVNRVLSEVTDFGNNIFGSGRMNPTYKEKYGVDGREYYELRFLANEVIQKFGNYEDFSLNYTNEGICAYLYGDIEERRDDLQKIEDYCNSKGFRCKFTNDKTWSGYNQYTVVKIEFKKE